MAVRIQIRLPGTCLVIQWLRVCLGTQRAWVGELRPHVSQRRPDVTRYIYFFKSDFPAILGAEIQQEYHKGSALKDSVGGRNSKQEEKKQCEWGGWLWADSGRRERRL